MTQQIQTEWGTFKDSLKAPLFGWFTYPAGFSYKGVENSIKKYGIKKNDTIYDPFMGSGTTNIVAKINNINSIGVEAHPFVFEITKSKLEWDIDENQVLTVLSTVSKNIEKKKNDSISKKKDIIKKEFPELIIKCFLPETLYELLITRNTINEVNDEKIKRFLRTALICTLRDVSIAATGWPYIAPKKIKITSRTKKGFETYSKKVLKMLSDIKDVSSKKYDRKTTHQLILGGSQITKIQNESVDHIFTSPPYLNNFDYADRTRLELYFMGDAKNWDDISTKIRTKLMTSATTQISRNDKKYNFLDEFIKTCPVQYKFLSAAVKKLSELRNTKGGKKSYDLLVTGYFNDMFQILKDNYRVLKPNSYALYILGDSAPYGVHIPTDKLIGEIGICVGFASYNIQVLRTRGDKWKTNPQRHNVKLQESIVVLKK